MYYLIAFAFLFAICECSEFNSLSYHLRTELKENNCSENEGCLLCDALDTTKCSICEAGYGLENGNCIECKAGEYSFGGKDVCKLCSEYSYCNHLDENEKINF